MAFAFRVLDLAASEQVIQAPYAVPPVTVTLDDEAMLATSVAATVVFRKQVDQQLSALGIVDLEPDREHDFLRVGSEIVDKQDPIVSPVVTHDQDRGILAADDGEIAPADFGHLFAHADDAFGPVQQRLRMAA